MKTFFVILLLLCLMGILGVSYYLISFWKHFWKFFYINLCVIVAYSVLILLGALSFLIDPDPYGMGAIFLFLKIILYHIIVSFVITLIINYRLTRFKNPS